MIKLFNLDFATKLGKIKKTFSKAIESAKKLEAQMDESISEKTSQVEELEKEIEEISLVKTQNSNFINNLTKLIE